MGAAMRALRGVAEDLPFLPLVSYFSAFRGFLFGLLWLRF
jgi:hypothetical protein